MTAITPDVPMARLLEIYPGAQRALFSRYHIGGCRSCGFRDDETLGQVCQRNDELPVAEVIAYLQESQAKDAERMIAPTDLGKRREANETLALLDVRTREEHESVAIPGSRLFTQETLNEIFAGWKKDREIVIYDHQGGGACLDAAAYLEGHGFSNVMALRGGIDAYAQEVDPSLPRYRVEFEPCGA